MDKPVLCLLVPCYNEEEVIGETFKRLNEIVQDLMHTCIIREDSFILFVDDGSVDNTWNMIKKMKDSSNIVKGLKLSRNFGHQNALLAGLMSVKDHTDCVISIDADLQQDEQEIYHFLEKYYEGFDIV